ncbi:probable protein lin-9 homolog at C-terminar half [Coccomyxa sp. Obi]|nr:probable protein lin-9 homolog at C-terminar half [Coccomyxa sp. Obi]
MKEGKYASASELHSPTPPPRGLQARQGGNTPGFWSQEEGRVFFSAFGKYHAPTPSNWQKVAKAVGSKDAAACEALYQRFQTYLSLPRALQHQTVFLALIRDMHNQASKADESGATISAGMGSGGEGEASEGGTSARLNAPTRARRTPRAPAPSIMRSGGRAQGVSLRSTDVLTPSQKKRDAEEEDVEVSTHTSWGGRGKRGAVPATATETPSKRRRVQARLQFFDESPKERGRRGLMDAGDADGADALLSLAALANEAANMPLPPLPASAARELESKLDDLAKQAAEPSSSGRERPKRHTKPPPRADESPPPPPPSARKPRPEPSASARKKREAARKQREKEEASREGGSKEVASREEEEGSRERGESPSRSVSTEPPQEPQEPERLGRGQRAARGRSWRRRGRGGDSSSDFTDLEEEEDDDEPQPKKPSKPRAPRLANLYKNGNQGGRGSADDAGAAKEGADDEMAASDHFWHGLSKKEPAPRLRRRKALPEKIPPMMSPIKSLFGRRTNAGLMLGLPGHTASTGGLPGVCFPGMEGEENGEPPGEPELRLRRCLDARTRRWAAAEFFYSGLDRPWFMQNELLDFLQHVGIPVSTKLTRTEWAALRAALGTPRRLSLNFLHQERGKLEAWRELVRRKYQEVGYNSEVPPEFPRQLTVSQRVTARHPVTRQLHDGDILTIAPDCYRVQFDRRELGVELVKDVDVMPIDPHESLPAGIQLRAASMVLNGRRAMTGGPVIKKQQRVWRSDSGGLRGPAAGRAQQEARAAAAAAAAQQQLRSEADVRALVEVSTVLDRKEALLMQLRTMNDEAEAGMHLDSSGRHTEAFQAAYAKVVLELKQVNEVLETSLGQLQARNNPHAEAVAAALNRTGSTERPGSSLMLPTSPLRARAAEAAGASHGGQPGVAQQKYATPEAAWEAAWKEGRRLVQKYQAELNQGTSDAGRTAAEAGSNAGGAAAAVQPGKQEQIAAGDGLLPTSGDSTEAAWLSDLVNGCVSMLITVHQCTESESSSAYVKKALDSALAALTPRAAANRPFLSDIQNSVDLLKQHLIY